MLKIKRNHFKKLGEWYDYELEDGTLLHQSEWNGETYTVGAGKEEKSYRPIYEHDEDVDQYDVIGFE